jgi:hypothetical protein
LDNNLEKSVVFEPKPENTLCKRALVETDSSGVKQKSEYIPFRWSTYFLATEVKFISRTEINTDETKSEEIISATLVPDESSQRYGAPKYRFFGTDRVIEKFELLIKASDTASMEIGGWPSYTFEGPHFDDETLPDTVCIEYCLSDKNFTQLRNLVNDGRLGLLALRLSGVDGFYSTWSPTIFANEIKILSRDVQIGAMPADQKDAFPSLSIASQVRDSHLTFEASVSLPFKMPLDILPKDPPMLVEEIEPVSSFASQQSQSLKTKKSTLGVKLLGTLLSGVFWLFIFWILLMIWTRLN